MLKLDDETRDKAVVLIGVAIGIFGNVCYQAADNIFKSSVLLWTGFIAEYVTFVIIGIWIAVKPIKRAYANNRVFEKQSLERHEAFEKQIMERQDNFEKQVLESIEKLEKRGTYLEIEDLLRHLAEIKLSLKTKNLLNGKKNFLNGDYNSVIEKIDSVSKDIEATMRKTKTL